MQHAGRQRVTGSFESGEYSAEDPVLRTTAIMGLVVIAALHFVQIVDTMKQTPWLGGGFLILIVGSMALAARFLVDGSFRIWFATSVLSAAAIAGYVLTRVMRTPFDNQDVGNWSETLGLAALFVEGILLVLSVVIVGRKGRLTKGHAVISRTIAVEERHYPEIA